LLPTLPPATWLKLPGSEPPVVFPSSKQAAASSSGSPSKVIVRREWFMVGLGLPTCIAQAESL
jgi:hypothetical protein